MGRGELLTRLRGFLAMFWGLAQECPQIGPWLPCLFPWRVLELDHQHYEKDVDHNQEGEQDDVAKESLPLLMLLSVPSGSMFLLPVLIIGITIDRDTDRHVLDCPRTPSAAVCRFILGPRAWMGREHATR